jgi:hypothetical protein
MPTRRVFLGALTATASALAVARADPDPSPSPIPTPEPPLPGRTFLPSLPSAPFPHPSRANGHDYAGKHFSAAESYGDSTVGIYVPSWYRSSNTTDLIVHFHGWSNHVAEVFRRYELREQLETSGVNAILVVPQGPKDAQDSSDGKLELDDGGFARFVADVASFLKSRGVVPTAEVRRIVLTAHSGGYGGAGGVLTRGGMNDRISDVILFDAAYAYYDALANWVMGSPDRHLLSLFTDDTSLGNANVMALLQGKRSYAVRDAAGMTLEQLQTRQPTFVLTNDVAHDELMQRYKWYELFLKTTALGES